jgi:hypothetical protein
VENKSWVTCVHGSIDIECDECARARPVALSKEQLFAAITARHTPRCRYNANCQVCELLHDLNVRPTPETPEQQSYVDTDGCPTEMAVLKRFWREKHALIPPDGPMPSGCAHQWKYFETNETLKGGCGFERCEHCGTERVAQSRRTAKANASEVLSDVARRAAALIPRHSDGGEGPTLEINLQPSKAAACNCPEVCKVCGGRAKACAVLGHRPEADRDVKWHECPTVNGTP